MMAAARRLTLRVSSQMASSMSSTVAAPDTPAAWTNPPSEPSEAAASATAAAIESDTATSTTAAWATTPRSRQRAAVSSAPVASMSQTATGRPTSARASAVDRPMPDPPPVMSTPVPGSPRRPGDDGVSTTWWMATGDDGVGMGRVFQTARRPSARPARSAQVRRPR